VLSNTAVESSQLVYLCKLFNIYVSIYIFLPCIRAVDKPGGPGPGEVSTPRNKDVNNRTHIRKF